MNIIQSVILTDLKLKKLITSGSAGEYGIVAQKGPVGEDTPLMGTSFYARSKILESSVALSLSETTGIPLVVTRIFNPIGIGMHPRFLLPNLIKQAGEIRAGERKTVELSRLDALRDYINVLDIAEAIKLIVESECSHKIYNIGSGKPITNKQLLEGIFRQQGVKAGSFSLVETLDIPEPNYAVNADISRMISDFDWKPKYDIDTTISQIAEAIATQENK
jgi:nucleoside-diphosphate-sugar epimerase